MADIKFSEFPKATTSKDSDEMAILQDGVNKMIASPVLESKIINKTVSRVIEQGGASLNLINVIGVVPTYADLALITPTPEINDAYQVEADGLVYVYTDNGFQAEGEGFNVQSEPTGVVEEGNTQAVSGDVVFSSVFGSERTDLNALLVNKGKRYPMKNYFDEALSNFIMFKKSFLEATVYSNDNSLYNYSIVQLNAKGHVLSGNRIDVRKKDKITNATISTYSFRTVGIGSETLTDYNRSQLNKLSSGNIETVSLIANDNTFKVEFTFDTSEFTNLTNITMSSADWNAFIFEGNVYKTYEEVLLKEEIHSISDRLPTKFTPTGIELTRNAEGILTADGTYVPSGSARASEKYPIDTTKDYYVSGQMAGVSFTLVAFYDDDDVFLGTQFQSSGTTFFIERERIVPVLGATKFAFSSYGTSFALDILENDTAASQSSVDTINDEVIDLQTSVGENYNSIEDLDVRVSALEANPNYKVFKAIQWENKVQASEQLLRDIYNQKIIDNPSYVAPYYGAGWAEGTSNPNTVERLGTPALHISLPIQNKIRGCVVRDGVVQYYLSTNSDYFKEDGITPSVLDGTDGDVMVEIPEFFYKWSDLSGGAYKQILLSEEAIPDYKFSPKHYIAKYESTVNREEDRLASVITTNFTRTNQELFIENASRYVESDNTGYSLGVQEVTDIDSYSLNAEKYRGVTNDSSLDNQLLPTDANYARNQLGRPVSSINRKTARQYAENANGVIQQYDSQKALYYLIMVEYATRDIQQAFSPNDVDGKRTGGLGIGATRYPDYVGYEKFYSPQGGNALIPIGVTASLGSRSGEIYFRIKNTPILTTGAGETAVIEEFGTVILPVMSYRGIENFYGHLYKIVDNIDGRISNIGGGVRRNEYYYQKNPFLTNDTNSVQGYYKIADVQFESSIRVIDQLLGGADGHILPVGEGGTNYTQFYCDCVEHITGWNGNNGDIKYLTYNGRIVSSTLVGLLFSVIAVDVVSDGNRASDTVRLQFF